MTIPACEVRPFEGGLLFQSDRVDLAREEVAGSLVRLGTIEDGVMRIDGARGQWDNDATGGARAFWAGEEETFLMAAAPGRAPRVRGVLLDPDALDRMARQSLGRSARLEGLGSGGDPALVRALRSFHQGLWEGGEPRAWQGWLELAVVRLVGQPADPATRESRAVRRAREYIHEHLDTSVSLEQLAVVSGLGRFQIMRAFARELGRTPHAYLRHLRLSRALLLLGQGTPTADVAAQLGFADQSHFTRAFREEFGVTPARFARGALQNARSSAARSISPASTSVSL